MAVSALRIEKRGEAEEPQLFQPVSIQGDGGEQDRRAYLLDGGYSCRDGVWYRRVGVVSSRSGKVVENGAVQLVDGGYFRKDGVWYKRVGVVACDR